MLSAEQVADVDASYVADPFMVNEGDRWYMFFEVLERSSRQGIISVAMSDDSYSWTYGGVVLREDFHLSYPCVFKSDGTYYMVPETAEAEAVRLYRSTDFPMQWSLAGELFPGAHRDPSIVHFNGLWWLFTCNTEHGANALQLHFAAELMGEWTEHPSSPLISHNPHITRPGGRILRYNDRLYRIAQDTVPVYGLQLFAFEILELSTESYVERLVWLATARSCGASARPGTASEFIIWMRTRSAMEVGSPRSIKLNQRGDRGLSDEEGRWQTAAVRFRNECFDLTCASCS
jgi:hypothetical protein